MAWAYVAASAANAGDSAGAGSIAVTLGAATSAGARVIVAVALWSTAPTNPAISSVSDGTNTFTLDASSGVFTVDTGFPQLVAVYSFDYAGIATPVVTVTYTGAGAGNMAGSVAVAAYTGLSTAAGAGAAVDVAVANDASLTVPGTATSTATANTTGANELVVGVYGDDGNTAVLGVTSGTSRTYRQTGSDAEIGLQDQDSGSSGTTQTTTWHFTSSGTNFYGALAVVYLLAGTVRPVTSIDRPHGDTRPAPFLPGSPYPRSSYGGL